MTWRLTGSVEEYAAAVGEFLGSDPERHTISLTVVANALAGAPPPAEPALYGWWTGADGRVASAVSHTPPYSLLLAGVPADAAAALALAVQATGRRLHGVNGSPAAAAAFASVWQERTGTSLRVAHEMRLHRLRELVLPDPPPPGGGRLASESDLPLLVDWMTAFASEAGVDAALDQRAGARDRLDYGGLSLWVSADVPVAMAGRSRAAGGVVRIGPVYTPPAFRRRGFGAAITAASTQSALDTGAAGVVLFTDLANPTSNAVYRRLGYHPVDDRVEIAFTAA